MVSDSSKSSRSIFLLQLLFIAVLFLEVTFAASTSETDNKKTFIFTEGVPTPLDEFVNKTCSESTSNDTLFLSPDYPMSDTAGGVCDLIVNKYDESICQIRIDFLSFYLAQPNSEGYCSTDFMTITGGSHSAPVLCGNNTGQHIYVDVAQEGCSLKIMVDMDSNVAFPRYFSMQITQVPCSSILLAPNGCLQYFPTTSGNVRSFNFPATVSDAKDDIEGGVTRQLSDTDYTACIRPEDGYSSISWTPDPDFSPYNFFVNGYASSLDDTVYGNVASVTTGSEICTQDHVIIPGASWSNFTGVTETTDRFCGAAFPNPATTSDMPFELYVRTDSSESPVDSGNIGFSLNFRQNIF